MGIPRRVSQVKGSAMSPQSMRFPLAALVAVSLVVAANAGDVYLGISMSDLSPSMARALQLSEGEGVLIDEIVTDSPADSAGLATGDVIIAIGKDKIDGAKGLSKTIRKYAPGDKITLEVLRRGQKTTLSATLGERPEKQIQIWRDKDLKKVWSFSGGDVESDPEIVIEGLDLGALDRGYLGVVPKDRDEGNGVVVDEIVDDGPAKAAGLRTGDVIVALDGEEIDDSDGLHEFLAETEPGQTIEVRVLREGKPQEFSVELAEPPGKGNLAKYFRMFRPDDPRQPGAPRYYEFHAVPPAPDAPHLEAEREEVAKLKEELDQLKQELKKLREDLAKEK